eukprot:TRINITY_DN70395_c0_g1_i1.p1 TRINITY_DN70395_c0_g1~~TRINITY_DN70395_c0_g1_i1.p1  ORF type:complete len:230 (-),score=42.97 TRINITY_DN70395_c0_g1_i1:243-932(-)
MSTVIGPPPEKVQNAFKDYDTSGDGLIAADKLSMVLRKLNDFSEEELEALFAGVEVDSDGKVNYEDFVLWLWSEFASSAEAEQARVKGLWEGSLASAIANGQKAYATRKESVQQYYDEVRARLTGKDYVDHIKTTFFERTDTNKDGRVDLNEATGLIFKSFQCCTQFHQKASSPTQDEIRSAFDAHDTKAFGRGRMGGDEFLNLTRYLQVRVAEAMLPFSSIIMKPADA